MTKAKQYRRERELELDSSKDRFIPSSVFSKDLSSLETIVKYLREVYDFSNQEIANLLDKNKQSIWRAYKQACKKNSKSLIVKDLQYPIPISILKSNLGVLQSIVFFLRDTHHLKFSEIAALLQRDDQTILTSYNKARGKMQ